MPRQEVFVLFQLYRQRSSFLAVYSSQESAETAIYQIGRNAVEKTVDRGTEIWRCTNDHPYLSDVSWTIMKVGILP